MIDYAMSARQWPPHEAEDLAHLSACIYFEPFVWKSFFQVDLPSQGELHFGADIDKCSEYHQ